ncbi:CsbD family protein [Gloeothece verrucosa]|uniref:CsbD family protein n=1 Tax=Gloeothece verrucosa (strain PCC 7822) TaxID=497965 RepID=E0UJL1_GLOV7|nr:CsbD family protein [Gloeothece verrucosa]ADN12255.1 CsbD family protein [Gloeothece verrucosa PCC 7822]
MSIEDRVDATVKNIDGKLQEALGEITGDPKAKTEGKAKQMEAEIQHSVENLKDEIKQAIN